MIDNHFEGATFHDETFNAQSNTTCLIHSDLFTVLKKRYITTRQCKWFEFSGTKYDQFKKVSNGYIILFPDIVSLYNNDLNVQSNYEPLNRNNDCIG